jgi:hypothetical protein
MVKNSDFLEYMDTNPFLFRPNKLTNFVMYVNSKEIPNEGLSLGMNEEKDVS